MLADRGFEIKQSVGPYCVRVTTLSWTRGQKQLTGIEVEQTRRIANVRIHLERVIGVVRQKFLILSETLPIDAAMEVYGDLPMLDRTVRVCCGFVNLCNSVVPRE